MGRRLDNSVASKRHDRREQRLQNRADFLGRRSARQLGLVLSSDKMKAFRLAIGSERLPDHIRKIGPVSSIVVAYEVEFEGRAVVALYDRHSRTVSSFMLMAALQELLAAHHRALVRDRGVR